MWLVGETVNSHAFHACIHGFESRTSHHFGGLAQLGEHLPYKQRVTGSSPVVPTISKVEIPWIINGPVVQLVRTPACHAGGRRFEPVPGRHLFASVAQSVEQRTENPRVSGSIPLRATKSSIILI